MKIEKISDNQIRCTLNRTDLAERELKMSELAYGSAKARELFRDMMQQASFEFGFEADDIPLMIEAIPVSSDCIILLITKVEDPEELDTRFSKFAPSHDDTFDGFDDDNTNDDFELNSLFAKIQELRDSMILSSEEMDKLENIAQDNSSDSPATDNTNSAITADSKTEEDSAASICRIFTFESLNQACDACSHVYHILDADASFYKDEATGVYSLVITNPVCDIDILNQACHILSEYGTRVRAVYATEDYYKEHLTTIIKKNAVRALGTL